LALPRFRSYTLQDIQHVVDNNDKKRFTLESFPDDTGHNTEWWIRANQGHSIAVDELALTPIVDPNELPTLVHGTYHRNWVAIQREGLSRMNRNHIHLATGLIGEDGVISGQ
jgi:2'-phosphotransferase